MPRRKIDRSTSADGKMIDMKTGKPVQVPVVPVICAQVRHFRELAGMEQKELAGRLGITSNTVSNWENGRARPDINLIPELCRVLGVSYADLFDAADPGADSAGLTPREKTLISRYAQLDAGNRQIVDSLIESMITVQEARQCPSLRRYSFFRKALAAGRGDPTEVDRLAAPVFLYRDRIAETLDTSAARRADCIFMVSGDSMEPVYTDRDLVLVERIPDAAALNVGEIGAFIVGNEMYIKKYSKEGLVSLNPRYPILRFDGEDNVFLIGRVVGKVDPACVASPEDVDKYRMVHEQEEDTKSPGNAFLQGTGYRSF
ncbi:MAG: XRE family transcriptional regulator [Eubacteriales bacterium]|nr:XRE family transcriptional regulator [Eubacteriales bacterium]